MAIVQIPANVRAYQCLSTDININGTVSGVMRGASIYVADKGLWYIVKSDLTLSPLVTNITAPNITIDSSFAGQIIITGSSLNTSGSNYSTTNSNGFMFKPHPQNLITIWISYHGGTPSNGYPILYTDSGYTFSGSALSSLDYGVIDSGSAVLCWSKI